MERHTGEFPWIFNSLSHISDDTEAPNPELSTGTYKKLQEKHGSFFQMIGKGMT